MVHWLIGLYSFDSEYWTPDLLDSRLIWYPILLFYIDSVEGYWSPDLFIWVSMQDIGCPIYLIVYRFDEEHWLSDLLDCSMLDIGCPIYLIVYRFDAEHWLSTWLFDAGHWLSDLLDYHLVWCGSLIIQFSCFTSIPIWFFPDCLSLIEVWERVSNEFDTKNGWKTIHTWHTLLRSLDQCVRCDERKN